MKSAKYFTASWCGPCQTFKPIIEELIKEGYPIEILDVDDNDELAKELAIRSVPTTIIFDGDTEQERFVGVKTKQLIKNRLET